MKKLPKFKNETQENQFWQKHDSSEFVDWSSAKSVVFPKLKPSSKTISLRLPESLLSGIRVLANKVDVPYQSLIKMILQDRLEKERTKV